MEEEAGGAPCILPAEDHSSTFEAATPVVVVVVARPRGAEDNDDDVSRSIDSCRSRCSRIADASLLRCWTIISPVGLAAPPGGGEPSPSPPPDDDDDDDEDPDDDDDDDPDPVALGGGREGPASDSGSVGSGVGALDAPPPRYGTIAPRSIATRNSPPASDLSIVAGLLPSSVGGKKSPSHRSILPSSSAPAAAARPNPRPSHDPPAGTNPKSKRNRIESRSSIPRSYRAMTCTTKVRGVASCNEQTWARSMRRRVCPSGEVRRWDDDGIAAGVVVVGGGGGDIGDGGGGGNDDDDDADDDDDEDDPSDVLRRRCRAVVGASSTRGEMSPRG